MAAAARNAGVSIATGDTKVVERGKADGLYITTTGVGVADPELICRPPPCVRVTRFSVPGRWVIMGQPS